MSAPLSVEDRLYRLEAVLGLVRAEGRAPGALIPRRVAVLEAAADHWMCGVHELTGRDSSRWLTNPRAAVVWAFRQSEPPMPFERIGQILGGRDHTTCIHFLRRARKLREADMLFAAFTDQLAQTAIQTTPFIERNAA